LGVYHFICFASPWRTSVESSDIFTEQGRLFGVIGLPTRYSSWSITFSPLSGLFYCSPILIVALIGIAAMLIDRAMLGELAAIVVICLIFLVGTAAFNGWNGGSAFGPRYVLPIIPLLGIPMAFAPSALRMLYIAL